MLKALLFAVLFAVLGLVVFALVAPLVFSGGDFRRIGATSFPFVVLICGTIGFFIGRRSRPKKQ